MSTITLSGIPSSLKPVFGGVFSSYVNVFGINVVGTSATSDAKVIHGASILAQYLDNDMDGVVDCPITQKKLFDNRATLMVFRDEDDSEETMESYFGSNFLKGINILLNGMPDSLQDLYGSEIEPNSISLIPSHAISGDYFETQFDASLEETLHLITHVGVSQAYPKVFGEEDDSVIYPLIENLNGNCGWGYTDDYINPSSGNCNGFYAYDDDSCDESCIQTEGIYWALTSILGAQNYTARSNEIANEWLLYNPNLVQQNANNLYNLLTDHATYNWLPENLPNGRYTATLPEAQINGVTDYASLIIGLIPIVIIIFIGIIFCLCRRGKCECCPRWCCGCRCCRPKLFTGNNNAVGTPGNPVTVAATPVPQ